MTKEELFRELAGKTCVLEGIHGILEVLDLGPDAPYLLHVPSVHGRATTSYQDIVAFSGRHWVTDLSLDRIRLAELARRFHIAMDVEQVGVVG